MSNTHSDMSSQALDGSDIATGSGSLFGISSETSLDDILLIHQIQIQGEQAYREYETRGDLEALETAIQSFRLAMDMTEDDSPEKADTLANLAVSLHARYKSMGDSRDLEESISLRQLADALTPDDSPDKPGMLRGLAVSLFSRFEQEGRSEDLEEAICLESHALELLPDNHPDKPALLNNLGGSLHRQFEHSGRSEDLIKAISLQSQAVDLTPDGDHHKPSRLMNLGNSLSVQFEQSGHLEDIEKAIKLHCQAVDLTPDGHPDKLMCLNNAGSSLQVRFNQLGNLDDLSQAIQLGTCAVNMSLDSHPLKPSWLNNLAGSLQCRYERAGDMQDLEQAIAHQSHAVTLTPDGHPDKPSQLNNLATKLKTRFKHSGNLADLDAAITHYTTAVTLIPEEHPDQQRLLYNLGIALQQRFNEVGDAADLDNAIRHATRSVKLLPENHTQQAQMLRLLGGLFLTRLHSPHAHVQDAPHAMEAFHQAMLHPDSPPLERLCASIQYADLLTQFPHFLPPSLPLSLLEAYKHALNLLPQCIWLGNNVHGRYASIQVKYAGVLTNEAVAAAITAGEYSLALEWLEAGRTVVTSQVLQLQTPLDDLGQFHPQLANELSQVSQALQHAAIGTSESLSTSFLPTSLSQAQPHTNSPAQSSHSQVLKYNDLIAHVRKLEGFEDFLRPKSLSQFASACASGPVVLINMHSSRCDALILHLPGTVTHVPLPSFSYNHAMGLQHILTTRCPRGRFRNALSDADMEEDRGGHIWGKDGEYNPMYGILKELWIHVVKPIIGVVCSLPTSDVKTHRLPHITWCPTGPLTFLPLHAAGIYQRGQSVESVMDYAISSYTPTLEALLKSRTQATSTSASQEPRVLIVSQPATPNCNPIPGTTLEAAIVMSLAGCSEESIVLDDEAGTVNAVLEGMETHEWVHLACHGVQNRENSLDSAFLLYDGRLNISTLMSKSLPNAELAVLSACQTATGDEKLADEVVHLAAWMLNIGYKSVIGTMWSISDSSAPILMEEFYRVLMAQVRTGEAIQPAYALHEAVKLLRTKCNNERNRWDWVPFVHFGR